MCWWDGVTELLEGGSEDDEKRLEGIAKDEPESLAWADEVGELTGGVGAGEEEGERNGGVDGGEGGVVKRRRDEGQREENSVAGLVGGEAMVFGKGDCIYMRQG